MFCFVKRSRLIPKKHAQIDHIRSFFCHFRSFLQYFLLFAFFLCYNVVDEYTEKENPL